MLCLCMYNVVTNVNYSVVHEVFFPEEKILGWRSHFIQSTQATFGPKEDGLEGLKCIAIGGAM